MLRLALLALVASTSGSSALDRGDDAQVRRATAALRSDKSLKVRVQAAFVLAQRGARVAVPVLQEALSEDGAVAVRVAAATALGRIGGPGVAAALRAASARDRDATVRTAAAQALDEVLRGARTVSVEAVQGGKGDRETREKLKRALVHHLQQQGFAVVDGGAAAGYRLKPSVLALEQAQKGTWLVVEVKASVIAIDGQGRIAAIVEGGARARTVASGHPAGRLTAQAFEAAARSISEDLARRLLEL
jgi:Holliday junction resolvase